MGEEAGKTSRISARCPALDVRQQGDISLRYPFGLEQAGPLKGNFLTEQTASSLLRKRVDSLERGFIFSWTKNTVKCQR